MVDALDLRGAPATITGALAAIAAVHGDGDLSRIPVRMVTGVEYAAAYRIATSMEPVEIVVNSSGVRQEWSMVHEIGHFLDHQALGERGAFASRSDERLEDWRRAVDNSSAVEHLTAILADGTVRAVDQGVERRIPVDARFIELQISYPELWARSYAQYVAVRGGSPTLLGQLASLLRSSVVGATPAYTLQWEAIDFMPIEGCIDLLFKERGWRR